jgi:hypothetical protein
MRRSFFFSMSLAAAFLQGSFALAANPTTTDCVTASNASLKLGEEHKLRAERSQLLVCANAACPAEIRKECLARVDEVSAQIPTIVLSAKDRKGTDISAVKVTMDGEVLAERLEGAALSIDPGEHTFKFETTDQPTVTTRLVIAQGQKDRHEQITFGAPEGVAPATGAVPSSSAGSGGGLGTQKILAIAAGGVGVVGLGIGTIFGLMASSQKSDAQNVCPNTVCQTQDGVNKWNTAGSTGDISTIGFVVGAVGVAGAAVLWLTAPSAGTTQVGLGPTGLQLRRSW